VISIVDNPGLGHSLGAVEYLTKPIDWRRLATALAKYRRAAAAGGPAAAGPGSSMLPGAANV
jgi:DNA-binding response OmpR family regulator